MVQRLLGAMAAICNSDHKDDRDGSTLDSGRLRHGAGNSAGGSLDGGGSVYGKEKTRRKEILYFVHLNSRQYIRVNMAQSGKI